MTIYSRDELMELASLYAIGATTDEESLAVDVAMRTDAELAAEVESFRTVATVMATSAPVAPSAGLRAALLAAAHDEKVSRVSDITAIRTVSAVSDATRVTPISSARQSRWMPFALAASVVVAAGLAANTFQLRKDVSTVQSAVADLEAKLEQRQRTLATVLGSQQDLHIVSLVSDSGASGPAVQFFWNAKERRAVASVSRLMPAPEGRDYQVWALVNGQPVSLGVFNSNADGNAVVEAFTLPVSTAGVTAVLVSLEPKGGSPQPTTTPFLAGSFAGI